MGKLEFLRQVQQQAALPNLEAAETVTEAVFRALHVRLTEGQAEHVETHLPADMKPMWAEPFLQKLVHRLKRVERLNKQAFLGRVQNRAHLANTHEAERVTTGVMHVLKAKLPEKEVEDVAAQLPDELQRLWEAA